MYDLKPYLQEIDEVISRGPYKDTWESLSEYEAPSWYRKAKFGIFIHWGVYSVPAYNNEWYPRNMYRKDSDEYKHHIETYGEHKDFGYKEFVPMFKAENFDAKKWVELFERAISKICLVNQSLQRNFYRIGSLEPVKSSISIALKLSILIGGFSIARQSHILRNWQHIIITEPSSGE